MGRSVLKSRLRLTASPAIADSGGATQRPALRPLAESIAAELAAEGWVVDEIAGVEGGWNLSIENTSFQVWLELRPDPARPDGVRLAVQPRAAHVRRLFRKIDTTEVLERLAASIDAAVGRIAGLAEPAWEDDVAKGGRGER